MNRLRKTSLSPCYSNMNKENLAIDNANCPIGISFRNLEEVRKKKIIDVGPHKSNEYYFTSGTFKKNSPSTNDKPVTVFREMVAKIGAGGERISDTSRKDSEKSVDEYRSSLRSKEKQMGSLQSQVSTLTSTISLLKEQVCSLRS